MSTAFGRDYAAAYDALYRDKNYDAEAELLDRVFRSAGGVTKVLDLGCGTGGHSIRLSQRGYQMTGVDASEEMLVRASEKSSSLGLPIAWVKADIRRLDLGETFDTAVAMFAVLGYVTEEEALRNVFAAVRRHLRQGGLFVFDFWYGPAVLAIGPSERSKELSIDGRRMTRRAKSDLDLARRVCTVRYRLEPLNDPSGRLTEETHEMRFFDAAEIHGLLSDAGFSSLSLSAFPSIDAPLDATTWNAICVARAV